MASEALTLMKALDLKNAWTLLTMGMKERQLGKTFAAYFRGADIGSLLGPGAAGADVLGQLSTLESRVGVGIARGAVMGGTALAGWSMLPRSDALAYPAGAGAGFAAWRGTEKLADWAGGGAKGFGLRAGASLFAGSLAFQGLRAARPGDFE